MAIITNYLASCQHQDLALNLEQLSPLRSISHCKKPPVLRGEISHFKATNKQTKKEVKNTGLTWEGDW